MLCLTRLREGFLLGPHGGNLISPRKEILWDPISSPTSALKTSPWRETIRDLSSNPKIPSWIAWSFSGGASLNSSWIEFRCNHSPFAFLLGKELCPEEEILGSAADRNVLLGEPNRSLRLRSTLNPPKKGVKKAPQKVSRCHQEPPGLVGSPVGHFPILGSQERKRLSPLNHFSI